MDDCHTYIPEILVQTQLNEIFIKPWLLHKWIIIISVSSWIGKPSTELNFIGENINVKKLSSFWFFDNIIRQSLTDVYI